MNRPNRAVRPAGLTALIVSARRIDLSATLLNDRGWTTDQIGEHMARLLRSTFVAGG